jgi:acyl carrier protein
MDDISRRILTIMSDAFDSDLQGKDIAGLTPETVENWDSLSFLNMILALEEEFKLSLDPDSIAEMTKGGQFVLELIKSKIES